MLLEQVLRGNTTGRMSLLSRSKGIGMIEALRADTDSQANSEEFSGLLDEKD